METELIAFLQHIKEEYGLSTDDYHNAEMWIQTLEAQANESKE